MAADERDGIPCLLMRAGTSKGAYFLAEHVPAARDERDELMLRVMGSPDPRQIDGLGGAHPLTSKVAIVSPSADAAELDYLFLQVGVDEAIVSDVQTCGNLLAGVGPFALERGLIAAGEPATTVRIRLVNTGATAVATFATRDGRFDHRGRTHIDGVPGEASAIRLELSAAPGRPLLPTGRLIDEVAGHAVTLIDNGMPVVLLDGAPLGVDGTETPSELEGREALATEVERLRRAAGPLMGLGDVGEQTVPKVVLLAPPHGRGAVATRAFIPSRVHTSIGVLMAASVAAGIRIPGTAAAHLARLPETGDDRTTMLEHPGGVFPAEVGVEQGADGAWHAVSVSLRTARKIFDGRVFPRPRRQNGEAP